MWPVFFAASVVFAVVGYSTERRALLGCIDEKLYTAARMLKSILPPDYHDRLVDQNSIAPQDYDNIIVDKNNKLCLELGLQYLWSCMVVDNNVIFTTSTSPSKDIKQKDHAKFFEVHRDPRAFEEVFRTMKPSYSSFHNEWGHGRMVLIPYRDIRGRLYCFGASMSIGEVAMILRNTLISYLFLFFAVLLAALLSSIILSASFSRPIVVLKDVAEKIARGKMDQKVRVKGAFELESLSESINFMSDSICEHLNRLEASEKRFRDLTESTSDFIWEMDENGAYTYASPKIKDLLGYQPQEVIGKTFFEFVVREEVDNAAAAFKAVSTPQKSFSGLVNKYLHKDGKVVVLDKSGVPIFDAQKLKGYRGIDRDVTGRKELEQEREELLKKLKELSLKDMVTESYNHKYLIERLTAELLRARRYDLPVSLIMIDIDYFNSVNDLYGHVYGDGILREFVQYLKSFSRGTDVVTRYGGEEFVIILLDTDRHSAAEFTQRLLSDIEKHTFDPEGKKIKLTISVGIVNFPEDDANLTEPSGFLHLAQKALSFAKEKGGARFFAFKVSPQEGALPKEDTKESVENLKQKLSKMEKKMRRAFLESIYAFAKTIEAKDYHTSAHCEDIVALVTEIGKKLNLSEDEMENLKHAAMLHDLGKIGIPDEILLKKGKLNEEEYAVIKRHPQIGAEIIRPIHFLQDIIPIILHHHEWFDGSGYVAGLKGKEIPLSSRIIAVADVYNALISDRPYRKAYSRLEAIEIIRQGSGTQFDPQIVEIFLQIVGIET